MVNKFLYETGVMDFGLYCVHDKSK